jgi:hypothetical protein
MIAGGILLNWGGCTFEEQRAEADLAQYEKMSDTIEAICVLFNKLLTDLFIEEYTLLPIDGGLPIEEELTWSS